MVPDIASVGGLRKVGDFPPVCRLSSTASIILKIAGIFGIYYYNPGRELMRSQNDVSREANAEVVLERVPCLGVSVEGAPRSTGYSYYGRTAQNGDFAANGMSAMDVASDVIHGYQEPCRGKKAMPTVESSYFSGRLVDRADLVSRLECTVRIYNADGFI